MNVGFLRLEHGGDAREEYMILKILEKVKGKIILPKEPSTPIREAGKEVDAYWRKGHEDKYVFINNDEIGQVIQDYDVVDTTEMCRWYGAEACKWHDNVIVTTMETNPLFMSGLAYSDDRIDVSCYNLIRKQANRFVARTEATKNCMIQAGLYFEDINIIHLPINLEKFKPRPKQIDLVPEIEDKKVVLYIGRLEWGKGIYQLVDQFAKISKKIPEAFLLIVGQAVQSPEINQYLEDRIKYHNISNRTKMLGYVKDVVPYYNLGDVFVSPQLRIEQYGWTFLEALASGLPILSNNIGTSSEFIVNGKNGYLSSNFDDMSNGLVSILEMDDVDAENMKKFSRKYAEKYFNPVTIAKEHVDLYKDSVKTHRNHLDAIYEDGISLWMKKYYIPTHKKVY